MKTESEKPVLIRYEGWRVSNGVDEFDNPYPGYTVQLYRNVFEVLKYTPCGAWIRTGSHWNENNELIESKSFVLLTPGKKRLAHATDELALESFIARKKRQRVIISEHLRFCNEQQNIAEEKLRKIKKETQDVNINAQSGPRIAAPGLGNETSDHETQPDAH